MLNAKIDRSSKDPPVIALNHPNASVPLRLLNRLAKYPVLTPGTGRTDPNLMITSIINV